MNKVWKCIALGLFLILFLNGVSLAADINKANDLFDKGLFQQALKEYESIFEKAADPQLRWQAFFRARESEAYLFRYGEAVKTIISTTLPQEMPQRGRILILKAEMLRNFLEQYSFIQRDDLIGQGEDKDVFRLTPAEIRNEIKQAYIQLWELRNQLAGMDLQQEGYFLDIKEVDFGMYPTLFDYLILRWTDFFFRAEALEPSEGMLKPRAALLLVEELKQRVNFDNPPALIAAELMEEASRMSQKARREAVERWKIKRLLLPLKHTRLFDLRDLAEDRALYDDKDLQEYRARAKDILLKWMERFRTKEAAAEAGYEAALILNLSGKFTEAVKLCEKIERSFPGTHAGDYARALRSSIEMPRLTLRAKTVLPPAKGAFSITTKNLKEVYFRTYHIDLDKLKEEYRFITKNESLGWSDLLRQPIPEWLKYFLELNPPSQQWSVSIDDKGDYQAITKTIDPPALAEGVYLVLACGDNSFEIGSTLFSTCFLNVTDFVLIGSAGLTTKTHDAYYDFLEAGARNEIEDTGFRFYTLSAETGKPLAGVDLDVYAYLSRRSKRDFFNLRTDKEGLVNFPLTVRVSPDAYNYYHVDPLARSKKSFSYWGSSQRLDYSSLNPIALFIETGRPIYRPQDTLQAKVIVVWRTAEGFRALGGENTQSVTFSAADPNFKEFFTESVQLNEFGSASVSFPIPADRLLGRYGLTARYRDGRFVNSSSVPFFVEEYKRPEFEVLLNPAADAWRYNQPINIEGRATYYFGAPLPEAPIKYRIKRQAFIPWFYRYWHEQAYPGQAQEIASGDLKTDAAGGFVISFTPTPAPQQYGGNIPDITQFIVEIEGRDSGGRTIQAQESYKAGENAIYFVIEPSKGFYLENEAITIASRRLTLNDTPAPGPSSYQVFALADAPAKKPPVLGRDYIRHQLRPPALDVQLNDVADGELLAEGRINHDQEGKGTIKLLPLPQGAYRITLKSQDKWGQDIEQSRIFVVAKDTKESVPINAALVMLAEKDAYEIGETARFVIGSALGSGVYHIELWAGRYFLSHRLIENNQPVCLIEIPVTKKMQGGFSLRWFGVKGFDAYSGQATIAVPWKEKKLEVGLELFEKELKPGEAVNWRVSVRDAAGRPAQAEVLALMYDRSLEYYITTSNPWLERLYDLRATPVNWSYIQVEPLSRSLPITKGLLDELLKASRKPKQPKLPALRTWRAWTMRHLDSPAVMMVEATPELEAYEEAAKKVETRKEFADSAFFKPHILTAVDGRGAFSFITPDQLTGWRIKLFAFTRDIKQGVLVEEAVTKKDLMVRADLPRFFREGDKGTITAIVHNESDQQLSGKLFIDITENEKNINQKLKLINNSANFKIEPHALASFNWMIEVPQGATTYEVRVAAASDKLSDAEQRQLPILPSRQRLVDSGFVALSGSESKTLEISLKDDPTRINESIVLQIDPQLALSILSTIPFLVEYPYESVEQFLNQYVPLSIINEVYKKHPAIRQILDKIPRRETLTLPWQKDDPRRLTALMETPWAWQSEGRPGPWPLIDLLDPKIVEAQKEISFNKLKAAQLASGAFPWWPGGRADPYITLYVLSGLAEARRYGVEVPGDIIQKALRYVNEEIPLLLEPETRILCLVSFAAYVMTSYSAYEFPEAEKGHQAVKSWLEFLEQHIYALTPLGKAYLSFTYLRLGNKERAEEVLDMAMDGAREDPIAGIYWTPEKYSWAWYSDSLEKHAFFLRTLQELRPADRRITPMVQWLLFSRKGTVWKSTKASVAAVYALLDYLQQQGALSGDETFKVKWGTKTYSEVVRADDWLAEPLRLQKTGFEITPQMSKAVIEKEGPGLAFASLTWVYSTDQIPEASSPGLLELERKFYRRVKEGDTYHLKPIASGGEVSLGEQIEVQLKINTRSQFEYMHLKDLKPAGFESEALLSGWKRDPLWFYEEIRDSLTNFFISWLPHGEYILRYRLRPTKPGAYRIGAAILQSMYAPEMSAHSAGFVIKVVEE